jgi:3-dehydrotetronate 4-kinase
VGHNLPMTSLLLGCIADDFTGATDLANNLARAGMRVVQAIGIPDEPAPPDVDCVVVALKSRSAPLEQAVAQSLEALQWLQSAGARQFYFKVCSTFDSTPEGNIGPVAEALMERLGESFCCVTPAFPENGRTVYKGHLFVGDVLLSESGMRHHPLTPMTDANLVRVMQSQVRGRVGLLEHSTVRAGPAAIRERMATLKAQGMRFGIVDALTDTDLHALGVALAGERLVVAGSGVAIGLPANFGIEPSPGAFRLPPASGTRAVVSGSCSVATHAQVRAFISSGGEAFRVDPLRLSQGEDLVQAALAWAQARLGSQPLLVYSTAAPEMVQAVQAALGVGVEEGARLIEAALAAIAQGLVDLGVGQLLVAGGETSGAVVQALGLRSLRIGPQIDPGVPWCHAVVPGGGGLHLALKSGNFGGPDFFTRAFKLLD